MPLLQKDLEQNPAQLLRPRGKFNCSECLKRHLGCSRCVNKTGAQFFKSFVFVVFRYLDEKIFIILPIKCCEIDLVYFILVELSIEKANSQVLFRRELFEENLCFVWSIRNQ